jgi:hypothetical protein
VSLNLTSLLNPATHCAVGRRIFWIFANIIMLAIIAGVVWATLLPSIWGPNPAAESELGGRRLRR